MSVGDDGVCTLRMMSARRETAVSCGNQGGTAVKYRPFVIVEMTEGRFYCEVSSKTRQ